jgi:hypothetical protein
MTTQEPIARATVPPRSQTLMRPCECGHNRYHHVAFAHDCRQAGCRCAMFVEAAEPRAPRLRAKESA